MADASNVILVRCDAERNREYTAVTADVYPGMVVEPTTALLAKPNTVVAAPISRLIARNHEAEGKTVAEVIAIGTRFKATLVEPGDEVRLYIKSGDTTAVNGDLKLATGGVLTTSGTDAKFAKALEVVTGPALCLSRIV